MGDTNNKTEEWFECVDFNSEVWHGQLSYFEQEKSVIFMKKEKEKKLDFERLVEKNKQDF